MGKLSFKYMLSVHLLPFTLLIAPVISAPQPATARTPQASDPVVSPSGTVLGSDENFDTAVGGRFTNPFGGAASIDVLPNRIFRINLSSTGTGWQESFLIGVPRTPAVPAAPLLVTFHSYGRLPDQVVHDSTYFQDAMDRGWFVIAPTGAHKFNFGIDYAQENIRVVMDWAQTFLPIDRERVYGVGFSMGGGGVACYAARHLNPEELMYAGLTNHTGTVSIRNDYDNAVDTSLYEHPMMFGASPAGNPFGYQRASTIDIQTGNGQVDPDSDLVRNLAHIPTTAFAVVNDPLMHLVNQAVQFHDQLVLRGGDSELMLGRGDEHAWATLDETQVLDFFEPLRLNMPGASSTTTTLADRDGRYIHFDITQSTSGTFSPFRWNVQKSQNRLFFDNAQNIASVGFDPADLGLDRSQTLSTILSTTGGNPVTLRLSGYNEPPSEVRRNGITVTNWTYEPASGTVTFIEELPARYPNWEIVP
ncbi:MAG: hypothetical protein ACI841_004396 [Planctomycetota bacterium]|jgi:hypothetical protein